MRLAVIQRIRTMSKEVEMIYQYQSMLCKYQYQLKYFMLCQFRED